MLAVEFTATDVWLLLAIAVLLLALMFLAIAETSIIRISPVKAQTLAEGGSRRAVALLGLVREPERFLNPVLLSINVCQIVQTVLVTLLAGRLFGAWGVVVATFLDVFVLFALTEALPKTWAVIATERAALATARPASALVRFAPLRWVSAALIGLANVILPGKGLKKGPFVSEQELLGIVETAAQEEVIEHEERELIESIIEFGDTLAREIMVPRPDMVTVPASSTVTAALDVAIEHGFSRLPVLGATIDDVMGIAYAKDLMRIEREGHGFQPVAGLARPARFVPETKPVNDLMREMQAGKQHMAIVVDEYGDVAGLATLEDCIEELVGDIVDEYDVEERDVEHLDGGELSVDGGLAIDELGELLHVELPEEDWDTVGGFVFGTLGHVPTEGEQVQYGGYVFTAEKVEGRRISRVRVTPPRDEHASGAEFVAG
jgi:CBS domain containing-hemolysin-like protein